MLTTTRNSAVANRSRVSCTQTNNGTEMTFRRFFERDISDNPEWPLDFKGHSGLSQMSCSIERMISYYRSLVAMTLQAILYHFQHIARHWSKIAIFIYPTCIQRPLGGDSVGISQRCLVLRETRMIGLPYGEERMVIHVLGNLLTSSPWIILLSEHLWKFSKLSQRRSPAVQLSIAVFFC